MIMIMKLSIMMVLALALAISSAEANTLCVEWPASYCYKIKKECNFKAVKPRFSLHGMWPPGGSHCRGEPFDETALLKDKGRKKELAAKWPSLKKKKTDVQFWEDEWRKHGDCTNPPMSVVDYFDRTLDLFQQEGDLVKALGTQGIHVGQAYSPTQFRKKMESVNGKPAVMCENAKHDNYLLLELQFCLNADSSKVINCTSVVMGPSCPRNAKATISINTTITV